MKSRILLQNHIRHLILCVAAAAGLLLFPQNSSSVAQISLEHEEKILRLAEIMGGIQFLHSLCSEQETTFWSDKMSELIDREISEPGHRRKYVEQYYLGFRGYAATHRTCTPTARQALEEYIAEGISITDTFLRQH